MGKGEDQESDIGGTSSGTRAPFSFIPDLHDTKGRRSNGYYVFMNLSFLSIIVMQRKVAPIDHPKESECYI